MSDVKITPLARRLAEENGIDWKQMSGSNPDGTIVERDVLAFLAKVMAGEIDLPGSPDPEPVGAMPMPDAIPDFTQVQAALERQGVNLGDVMPKAAAPSVQTEEIPDLDMDFDLDLDDPLPDLEEPIFASEPALALADEPILAAEPENISWSEPQNTTWSEPQNTTWPEPPSAPTMSDWNVSPSPSDTRPPAPSNNWGDLSFDAAPPAPPVEPAVQAKEPALDDFVWDTPSPASAPAPEPALTWEDVPPPVSQPVAPPIAQPVVPPVAQPVAPMAAMPQVAPVIEEPEPIPAPAVPPVIPAAAPTAAVASTLTAAPAAAPANPVQLWQRLVEVAGTFESALHLAEAWKREVTVYPFLFRAAEKALADIESPLRALKGTLRGESLASYRVPPSHTLRGSIESLEAASEPSTGLSVLSMEGGSCDLIVFPTANVLSLGRAASGMAILSLYGNLEAQQASTLLERVAYYLERPILLA